MSLGLFCPNTVEARDRSTGPPRALPQVYFLILVNISFFLKITLLRCVFYAIKFTHVYNSIICSNFIQLCHHHHDPSLERFHYSQKVPVPICSHPPSPCPTLGNHLFTFCLYRFSFSRHVIKMELYSMCPSVSFSLSMMFLRFIHVVAWISTLFFLLLNGIALYG